MNRSWRNTSNNTSTGFVYFNTSSSNYNPNSQQSPDTPEFLSFGSESSPGSSPHGSQFSPSNYSSPRKFYGGKSPRQRGGRNQYYTPIKQTGGKYWRRNVGLTGSAEMNVNTNNYSNFVEHQHSQNRSYQSHKKIKSFHHNAPNQSFNASAFYDPTCLKDPWAELEQKLVEDRKKREDNLLQSKSQLSQSMDADAEEASSDESGSASEEDSNEMEESFS